jgi:hypothetical protein
MIACVSPSTTDLAESLNTLRWVWGEGGGDQLTGWLVGMVQERAGVWGGGRGEKCGREDVRGRGKRWTNNLAESLHPLRWIKGEECLEYGREGWNGHG